eukprot:8772416-Alexandrium_andersonii.AAC.1
MASYLQEHEDPDDLVECVACQFSVREVYLLTDDDRVPRLYPGDALCEACSYATRYKRYLDALPNDGITDEYRRYLARERKDAAALQR